METVMNYVERINSLLRPSENRSPLVLDLFAGCGGLALGFEAQGFETRGFEQDKDACETYRKNLKGDCEQMVLTTETILPNAKVIIGGPPCQPFSVGGHQLGLKDSRDGFPIFISAVERLQPDIWMFENVRGVLYSNRSYFEQILAALGALNYVIEVRLLNAVNFGVPQNRERVVVVGHRGQFQFPKEDPNRVSVRDAIGDLMFSAPSDSKFLTASMDEYVAKYEKASFCIRPRDLYPDQPSRTLTCRNLAGATGDMHRVRLADGRRRRLTFREAARLQSFPDSFDFCGGETSQFNQIGNAVAPIFAWHLAGAVKNYLASSERLTSGEILYRNLPNQFALPLEFKESPEMKIPTFVTNAAKPPKMVKLFNEGLLVLSKLGIPLEGLKPRELEKMAMAFLAVADVKRSSDWPKARVRIGKEPLKSREIIAYLNENFQEQISMGSYDDIRRKDLKLPVVAGIIVASANKPNAARNDPTRGYSLSPEYIGVIQRFGQTEWLEEIEEFMADRPTLAERLEASRHLNIVPIKLPDGTNLSFSPGQHNLLQKSVIEQFLPRFGYGAEVLYVGDTAKKFLVRNEAKLESLKFFEIEHGELPDVIAYSQQKNWLFLVEAVHSSGPISAIRLLELQRLANKCTADIVYVTAFLDRNTFRKFTPDIAWETEVWIADAPDHLIHFDGDKFLGPYKSPKPE
ncbi:MAG: BsuBI/PstI family type II restriction endonuclease [Verrucomicrobiota bacterium]